MKDKSLRKSKPIEIFKKDKLRSCSNSFLFFLSVSVLLAGCSKDSGKLFQLLPEGLTGITFSNDILEDEYFNIISYEYLFNGGGVGVGDFNNDGLQDIFFSGNMVSNRLYMNQGDLHFTDITKIAGIEAKDRWCTGVAVMDVNADGWMDLYVCTSYNSSSELRENLLFINKGLNSDGIPEFIEMADSYGVNDDGYSTNAAFFDYDNDGDLDLYVLTNFLETDWPNKYRSKKNDGSAISTDRLYRNNGNNTFDNVSQNAGILHEGYGLGISILDINRDGWKDIYITNDYLTNDLFYVNNQDGTFSNNISNYLKHMGHSAMGHDIADINNDGLPDIYSLDMLPEDNQRLKQMYAGSRFMNNSDNEKYGYDYQYKHNMLQLNNGQDVYGNHYFSEIGLLSGAYATDWSWSALLADFDNDGFRDLFVSNGYPRDVTDLDYATSGNRRSMGGSMEEELLMIPDRHIQNYLFKNNGNYTFSDKSEEWGMDAPSYSNGASFVDLDNDGDLDIVTNNINEPASVYQNLLYDQHLKNSDFHYLRIKLKNENHTGNGQGTIVYVFIDDQILYSEHSVYHGYLSSTDPVLHFGLGDHVSIDSLWIFWPDGLFEPKYHIPIDTIFEIEYNPSALTRGFPIIAPDENTYLFKPVDSAIAVNFVHKQIPFNDFSIQPAIPYQYSQSGPGISIADIDGNNEMDIIIGGTKDQGASIFLQKDGVFSRKELLENLNNRQQDRGILLFDADNDGDNDLYLVSGGYSQELTSDQFQDRLYINDGKGNFSINTTALPVMNSNGSCVKAADIDGDNDLDLFIGGNVLPEKYPFPSSSYILRNDSKNGKVLFSDQTDILCRELSNIGIVNDALWSDFNNDNKVDLIVVGDWMPISFFQNEGGIFRNVTQKSGIQNEIGWWNSIAGGDFDNDGDIDYFSGNLGLNSFYKASTQEPITLYAADFDNNGSIDPVITQYMKDISGERKPFPVHFKNDISKQIEFVNQRLPGFKRYSEANIDSLFFSNELENALTLEANYFESSFIENLGDGNFKLKALPKEVQFAPVFGMLTADLNQDNYLDILLTGNFYGNNPFWGRYDAFNGLVLLNNGENEFTPLNYTKTGFLAEGDAKAIVSIPLSTGKEMILITQNQDELKNLSLNKSSDIISIKTYAFYTMMEFENGIKRKQEFYYGNSYLSQSARIFSKPGNVESYEIYSFNGSKQE